MRRKIKLTAPPLSVARVVAALVSLGAAAVMAYAVLTGDTTLTLTGARCLTWAGLVFLVLFAVERTGRKVRTSGGRR